MKHGVALVALLCLGTVSPASSAVYSATDLCRLSLGPKPKQTPQDLDALYRQAFSAKPVFDQAMTEAAQEVGASFDSGPLKEISRIQDKAAGRGGGELHSVLDIVRGAIVADTLQGVYEAVASVQRTAERHGLKVERTNDYFQSPKESGYRGLRINLRIPYFGPNGMRGTHIAELQVHHRKLYDLKKTKGDALYRQIRAIEESEPRALWSAGKLAEYKELSHRHRVLFDRAWREIAGQEGFKP